MAGWFRSLVLAVVCAALIWVAWRLAVAEGTRTARRPAPVALSPAEARQQEILKANVGKPGDPELTGQYVALNVKHFSGELPAIAVRWDPALADVGPLSGHGFTLQGMYGLAGETGFILLNPILREDPRALERALSHEMVHAYLHSIGEDLAAHGPAFQAVLQRLATEGAFEGIVSDPREKVRLRAWLDDASARLDAARRDMDVLDAEIKQIGAELDREIAAFNTRPDRSAAEADALEARRQHYNQRVLDANERIERGREDLALFNREVARYNLMMAYPDGLDEASVVASRPALPSSGRR